MSEEIKPFNKPTKLKVSRSRIIFMVLMGLLVVSGIYLAQTVWSKPVWIEDDPDKAYSRFVTHLPEVDAVSISLMSHHSSTNQGALGKAVRWNESRFVVMAERTLKTKDAIDFSRAWRNLPEQKYASAGCHEPAYGLRFYQHGKLILETTFCWKCNNISMLSSKGEYYIDFDKRSPHAKSLWKLMQEYVPLEASAGTQP